MPPPTKWLEPGGIVFSVRTSVPFCFCQYLKNREVVLHQTWYEGISCGIKLCLDFRVTGSKVTGYFVEKKIGTVFYIL